MPRETPQRLPGNLALGLQAGKLGGMGALPSWPASRALPRGCPLADWEEAGHKFRVLPVLKGTCSGQKHPQSCVSLKDVRSL